MPLTTFKQVTDRQSQLGNVQWLVGWYGMGKTSVASRFNIPGRIAWFTMEAPGFLLLSYLVKTMPAAHGITDLPWQNKVLAGLFVWPTPSHTVPLVPLVLALC